MSKIVTVYHGTGSYCLPGFMSSEPRLSYRSYLKGRKKMAFCASVEFKEAARFAVRRTTQEEFANGGCGIVIEFELFGIEGQDFVESQDSHSLFEKQEISVLNPSSLRMLGQDAGARNADYARRPCWLEDRTMSKKAIKVVEVVEAGNLNIQKGDLFEDIIAEGANALDSNEATEIVGGGILLKGNDGKWYTVTVEVCIDEASKDFVKMTLKDKEQETADEEKR